MVSPETVASYRCGWWWCYPDVWGKFACGKNLPTLTLINFRSCAKSCRDEHEIWVRQIHHSWVADPFIATPLKNHHRRSSWGKEKTHLRCTHGKWSLWRRISPNAKLKMKRWLLWWNASCNWVPDTVPHPSFFRYIHDTSRARMYFKFSTTTFEPLWNPWYSFSNKKRRK